MGCTSYTNNPEVVFNNFFSSLFIRKKTPKEYYLYLKEAMIETYAKKETLSYLHNKLQDLVFYSLLYMDKSRDLFRLYLSQYGNNVSRTLSDNEESNHEYGYFLLSMIFLCKPSSEEAYEAAVCIVKDWKIPLKGDMIEKVILQKMLRIYISMISTLAIGVLKSLSENEESFAQTMSNSFKPKAQQVFCDNILLSHLKATHLRLYKFYQKNYYDLIYDDQIRMKLLVLSNDEAQRERTKSVALLKANTMQDQVKEETKEGKESKLDKEEGFTISSSISRTEY